MRAAIFFGQDGGLLAQPSAEQEGEDDAYEHDDFEQIGG
jgi:hypothetical protein